jgi:hypothetical protein
VNTVEVVERALSVVGKGCAYKLGRGGMRPNDSVPWDSQRLCDCSGFVAWVLRVSRETDNPWYKAHNGGWIETSAIVRDCETPFGFFAQVDRRKARPGDLLVYGDYKDGSGKLIQGHVGICSEVDAKGPIMVVHCSSGNYRKTGDAIRETSPQWWDLAGGIVARCAWVEP